MVINVLLIYDISFKMFLLYIIQILLFSSIKKNIDKGVLIDKTWDLPKALLLSYLYRHHKGDIIVISPMQSYRFFRS